MLLITSEHRCQVCYPRTYAFPLLQPLRWHSTLGKFVAAFCKHDFNIKTS